MALEGAFSVIEKSSRSFVPSCTKYQPRSDRKECSWYPYLYLVPGRVTITDGHQTAVDNIYQHCTLNIYCIVSPSTITIYLALLWKPWQRPEKESQRGSWDNYKAGGCITAQANSSLVILTNWQDGSCHLYFSRVAVDMRISPVMLDLGFLCQHHLLFVTIVPCEEVGLPITSLWVTHHMPSSLHTKC